MNQETTPCPCQSERSYSECCGPILEGSAKAQTATELMRARYTAYAQGKVDFVAKTHLPNDKEDFDRDEALKWAKESKWEGLEVVREEEGGVDDHQGVVEFIARYKISNQKMGERMVEHHEIADFKKVDGEWFFEQGRMVGQGTIKRNGPKLGRNDACHCGSGKKYKKCCLSQDQKPKVALSSQVV